MTDYSLTPEAEALICTELQKAIRYALGLTLFVAARKVQAKLKTHTPHKKLS